MRMMTDLKVEHINTVDSTNAELKRRLLSGAVSGVCALRADTQTAGRGRRGRVWLNTDGALMMSVCLPLDGFSERETMLLSLTAAYAVKTAIAPYFDCAAIKWPNDVVVERGGEIKKLCGILTEIVSAPCGTRYAVVGMGVNSNCDSVPEGLMQPATSIKAESGKNVDIEALAKNVFGLLIYYVNKLLSDTDSVFAEIKKHIITLGRPVRAVCSNGDEICGKAAEITLDGRLVLETKRGSIILDAADVSIRTITD
ncbi:MAG: biotin--[Clostridia bacterium]|nr:biotin--[acetyl-CoA-carboxylase] ligase [Clostridia bacterium]